ncbi:MAG: bacillithiol biosynthesis deacetylase BshB1 [Cryomorphaceae bacterium]|nr:bacillithiol biosynthesis deacetylase BshB1 [Cryomorphaceae bacterium]
MTNKVDVLAIGAHPDDVELGCGGAIAKFAAEGKLVAILDLTKGEMGTRGSVEKRKEEADAAAKILGISHRAQANLPDGWISNDKASQLEVIKWIRYFQPTLLLINAPTDRHPDHPHAANLCLDAAFKSGLKNIVTEHLGHVQSYHRPRSVYHYIQFWNIEPDIIMDISGYLDKKLAAVNAYDSQFFNPNSDEPKTAISSKNFLDSVTYRAQDMGRLIYKDAGEGFIRAQPVGCKSLLDLF